MRPIVIQLPPERLDELRVTLLDHDNTREIRKSSKHEDFRITYAGGVIVGYTSGKIVINNLEASRLVRKVIMKMEFDTDYDYVIGSDEAGKGEWLGPLTVSAVALTPAQSNILRSLGVMDSKELTLDRMGELAYEIEDNSMAIKTVVITPERFNEMFEQLHSEGKNLNDMLAWAHATAISDTYKSLSLKPGQKVRIVIDEFARDKAEERLSRVLKLKSVELVQRPRAEDEIAVASASIMARDAREEWIDKASLRFKVELAGLTIERARRMDNQHLFTKIKYLGD